MNHLSPYGLRCGNIHDPRVAGVHSSWLPHSEVPVSSLDTDMNVDKTHHELLANLSQENSLLPKVLWDNRPSLKNASFAVNDDDINTEWRDVYALVCNLANLNDFTMTKSVIANKSNLSELQRLCIALHMNVDINRARGYIYKPRHLIYNELCMVVSSSHFFFIFVLPSCVTHLCAFSCERSISSFSILNLFQIR